MSNELDTEVPPIAVNGRWINLRPVSSADYRSFLSWRTDVNELHVWTATRRLPTVEEFQEEIEKLLRQSITLLVERREGREAIGFMQAYNLNAGEGWTFSLGYIQPRYRRGHGAEAYAWFLDYLFGNFPLRKVYADVYEFNMASMKPLITGGFVEEGCFKEHAWFRDRFWDVFRLAMYRDAWNEFRDRTHLLIGVARAVDESHPEPAANSKASPDRLEPHEHLAESAIP
jgi:RimJ/RimL family protein N-acetyltransferase